MWALSLILIFYAHLFFSDLKVTTLGAWQHVLCKTCPCAIEGG